jgi:hypothetical protein
VKLTRIGGFMEAKLSLQSKKAKVAPYTNPIQPHFKEIKRLSLLGFPDTPLK